MTIDTATRGIVYNIQRYTIHDGPGIRTEVFLKGCPMYCKWCSNPESLNSKREVGVYRSKCLGIEKCGACLESCPLNGEPLIFKDNGIFEIDRDKCLGCMKCTENCYTGALKSWGEYMSVDDVMKQVLADRSFYTRSGGGITLNGGEVAGQWKFSVALLEASRRNHINTCIETSMQCKSDTLKKFYNLCDWIITDIKCMDDNVHIANCGMSNKQILKNIKMTVDAGVRLIIRIPVIPGINDDERNIRKAGAFIRDELGNRIERLQLLPYKKMGLEKYESLGIKYPMGEDYQMLEHAKMDKKLREIESVLREYGVPVVIGANEKLS